MSDYIAFFNFLQSEQLSMAKFIILMIPLIILMMIYKAPDFYKLWYEHQKDKQACQHKMPK